MACVLLLSLMSKLHAATDPDDQTRACVANAGSMGAIVSCERAAQERWHAELASYHNALLGALNGVAQEHYAAAQSAWKRFQEAEFALIEQTLGESDPLAGGALAEGAKSTLLRQRAEQLASYLHAVRTRHGD